MKKRLFRLLSLILTFCLVAGLSSPASFAVSADNLKTYEITFETTAAGVQKGMIYQQGGRYYMTLDDIVKYTDSSKTEAGAIVTVKRGSRTIQIDTSSGTLSEEYVENKTPSGMIRNGEKKLYPAYAMLEYLGASCAFQNGRLAISMPAYSLWDALDFPFLNYALTPDKLWGNDLGVNLFCDSIMEFLKEMEPECPYGEILGESLNDVMKIEPTDFDAGVGEETAYLARIKRVMNLPDVVSSGLEGFKNDLSQSKDTFDFASDFLGIARQTIDESASASFKKLNFDKSFGNDILNSIKFKEMGEALDKASGAVDIVSTAADIFATTLDRCNYSTDSVSAVSTLFEAYPNNVPDYQNSICYPVIRELNAALKSKKNAAIATVCDKMLNFAQKKMTDEGIDMFADEIGAGKYLKAAKVGSFVTFLLPWNQEAFKSADADLRSILLVQLLLECGDCLNGTAVKIQNTSYKDETLLDDYRKMAVFWTKATIAANNELIIEAQNGGNASFIPMLNKNNEELSKFLFRLINARVSAIPEYKALLSSPNFDRSITGLTEIKESPVSDREKEAIRQYLVSIADIAKGSMPPFTTIAAIDKNWVISSTWMKSTNHSASYQSPDGYPYESVALSDIEKEAQKDINPGITLPADGDYSYFNNITAIRPKWIPKEKVFIYVGSDLPSDTWDYPITSAVKSGNLYTVTCPEIYYCTFNLERGSTDIDRLFNNGKQVGTVQENTDPFGTYYTPILHYSVNTATLPQITFVLQAGGAKGYSVVSKSGAQTKCIYP